MKADSRMLPSTRRPRRAVWRRARRPLLLLGIPVLAILAAVAFWLQGGRYAATENAFVKADILQIASEVSGRVAEVMVRDHAVVVAGDVLLRLDPEPYRLAVEKADAEIDTARAAVEALKASLREAKAEAQEAENRLAYLDTQAKRQLELSGRGATTVTRLEQADSDVAQARDRVTMLQARVARVEATLGSNPNRATDRYAAVREKVAARDRAALDLANATIRAPRAGIVVNLRLQVGDQVRPQTPLFSVVADRRPWVEANFKETDLTYVTVGQKATVVVDMYPSFTWDAEVESISPATGAEFAILPPQNASGNWVKVVQRLPVKLRLIARDGEPPLRPGMTAYVSVDTNRTRQLADIFGGGTAAAAKP